MFQQMIHNVGKLAVKIDHFAKTPERSWEFWTINLRVVGEGESTTHETSYAVNTEPTTLIALFGLNKETTIFQAPPKIDPLITGEMNTPAYIHEANASA